MMSSIRKCAAFAVLLSLSLSCTSPPKPGEHHTLITESGAWCWFADPRAICGGPGPRLYAGWVNRDGDIQVGAVHARTQEIETATLHPKLERDDHANPALLELPDGRLMAFYSKHGGQDMFQRTTVRPWDISEWTAETTIPVHKDNAPRKTITYPNPVLIREESNRIYLFWRGDDWKPTFTWSDDLGKTWAPVKTLVARRGSGLDNRPYMKVHQGLGGRIHFAFTDGHPRNEKHNSIYYLAYHKGAFFRADGTRVGTMADLPLDPARADKVYEASRSGARAWIWEVGDDLEGKPVLVYTRHPKMTDHRYHYARWDGGTWRDHEITAAGHWFPQTPEGKDEPEPHYSGGICLDPYDPAHVFLSRQVRGVFEIEQWVTTDHGRTWETRPVTERSKLDNVRPFVPRGYTTGLPWVLWMNGPYRHYLDYNTSIRSW
jgi:BNR repeat-containing family member